MQKSADNLYLHIDGDSFFVGCEVSLRPELKGKPVIVGADRGIAVAMSMEAKKLGVTRGMPVFKIKKFFPEVVILPHNFVLYQDIADRLYQILSSYFIEVEEYSIDECFALAQPFEVRYHGGVEKLMASIKEEIQKTLGVSYSLGLARTKALSKLASKLEKPNGSVMLLTHEDEVRALQATPINDIWGIGRRTVPVLERMGMKTAYDFVKYPADNIFKIFAEPIQVLQKELSGEQIMEVKSHTDPRDQKSIQSTATFRPSSADPKIIKRELAEKAEHACEEARKLNLVSNKVSFFLKTSEFKYRFDEVKLDQYTADPGKVLGAIEPKVAELLKKKEIIRATGVMLHGLVRQEDVPRDLFGKQEKEMSYMVVETAADQIRKKFGHDAIKRAASLGKSTPRSTVGSSFKKGSR